MAMRGKKKAVDDGAIRALLKQYACPFQYHQVRARFMGNIATPDMNAWPMKEVQRLWNDDLPVFDSQKEAEAFFSAPLQGLWNGLSAHQKRSDPFKLGRVNAAPAAMNTSRVSAGSAARRSMVSSTGFLPDGKRWIFLRAHTRRSAS